MNGRDIALWFLAGVLGSVMTAQAAAVTLAWDSSDSPDVTGYKLRYWPIDPPNPDPPITVVDVGLVTRYKVEGLLRGVKYLFAVQAYAADGRTSDFSNEEPYRVPTDEPTRTFPLVVAVDSPELTTEKGDGRNAVDNDPMTIWHTGWSTPTPPPHPHYIILDLGAVYTVYGVRYLPRQDGLLDGTILGYELYISLDVATWDRPWIVGVWAATTTPKILLENSGPRGRYVKLVSTSSTNEGRDASAAEIQIIVGLP